MGQDLKLSSGHLTHTSGGHLALCPPPACTNCNSGTTHFRYGCTLPNIFTDNGTCTAGQCTNLNGAGVIVTQDPMNPCHWSLFIPAGVLLCAMGFDLYLGLGNPVNPLATIGYYVSPGGFLGVGWESTAALPVDCGSFTLAYNAGLVNAGACDIAAPGNLTVTGL